MTKLGFMQITIYIGVILILAKPLGWYMAQVYLGKPSGLNWIANPFERFLYRLAGIDPKQDMDWKRYLTNMLFFSLISAISTYLIQRCQGYLPFNPQEFPGVSSDLAFNTAASFITNTNWQAYSGETTMSYFTQMFAFTVQNFVSAAVGMALLIALIRGLVREESKGVGNFWVDLVRGVLYILLPLSFVLAVILTSQGVIQNFKPYQKTRSLQTVNANISTKLQLIPMGPVASQVAIKQLGTNGGGFFQANAAHPFENPTPLTNFLEMLALVLIPASFCYTFGIMVKSDKQVYVLLATMFMIFIPFAVGGVFTEQQGNPALSQLGIDPHPQIQSYPGGNMEGKETRFGIVSSALWSVATTASGNGSVNAMLDSFTPLGGMMPLWMLSFEEIIFGGVGSGLYGMLMMLILTVFVVGLMVGRTPEYLEKKIDPYEVKMAAVCMLITPVLALVCTAVACVIPMGLAARSNPGPHGLTEILYGFTSLVNNNGSSFSGLKANTPFYNITGGLVMLLARYWIAIAILAIAGSLAKKKRIPHTKGTLSTNNFMFVMLLWSVILIVGTLSFMPVFSLGPVIEHLMLWGK